MESTNNDDDSKKRPSLPFLMDILNWHNLDADLQNTIATTYGHHDNGRFEEWLNEHAFDIMLSKPGDASNEQVHDLCDKLQVLLQIVELDAKKKYVKHSNMKTEQTTHFQTLFLTPSSFCILLF